MLAEHRVAGLEYCGHGNGQGVRGAVAEQHVIGVGRHLLLGQPGADHIAVLGQTLGRVERGDEIVATLTG
ncbi:hypothetical protein D9M68_788220 [compost metagenome]